MIATRQASQSTPNRLRPARFMLLVAGLAVLLHVLVILAMARADLAEVQAVSPQRPVEVSLLPPPSPAVEPAPDSVARPSASIRPRVPANPAGRPPGPSASVTPSQPDSQQSASVTAPPGSPVEAIVESASETAAAPVTQPAASAEPLPLDQPAPTASAADGSTPGQATPRLVVPALAGSHERRFRVYYGDFEAGQSVARLAYRLEVEGDRYLIRTEAQAEGLIALVYSGAVSQTSMGRIGPHGLQPLSYIETRGQGSRRMTAFDPDARTLTPAGQEPVTVPDGLQDRLSVFYQLGLLARADPALFAAGASVELPVATSRSVQIERFAVIGEEVLALPDGPLRALHLRRPAPVGSRDPGIDLWLGYDFGMLPVRLRIEDASRRVLDQIIDRAS